MKPIRIAIDGPASSGKSTVAKIIAKDLDLTYLDTGAMYRACALVALQKETVDTTVITEFIHKNPLKFGQGRVFLGLNDITKIIRSNDVTAKVSEVAAMPEIRDLMTAEQRRIAKDGNIIMDGRDIGTVVLPDAELKIFLVADVAERAERRYKENLEKGIPSDLDALRKDIAARDKYDSERQVAPLKKATDAIEVDTTGLPIEEVVSIIEKHIQAIELK
ncbi:MAG: (d)CMP kinase [Streptococcaceae bacterium]|jgi:cytidylate kinase|nr:(d)CMP kinase [Streptococcaceae bacterium]